MSWMPMRLETVISASCLSGPLGGHQYPADSAWPPYVRVIKCGPQKGLEVVRRPAGAVAEIRPLARAERQRRLGRVPCAPDRHGVDLNFPAPSGHSDSVPGEFEPGKRPQPFSGQPLQLPGFGLAHLLERRFRVCQLPGPMPSSGHRDSTHISKKALWGHADGPFRGRCRASRCIRPGQACGSEFRAQIWPARLCPAAPFPGTAIPPRPSACPWDAVKAAGRPFLRLRRE